MSPTPPEPPLKPVHMPVFPTMDSLQDAVDYADSKLPITTRNELFVLFAVYHNTLLNIVQHRQS